MVLKRDETLIKNAINADDAPMSNSMEQEDIKPAYDEDIPAPTGMVESEEAAPVESMAIPETEVSTQQSTNITDNINITERIHEISEAIVNEKWEDFISKIGDLPIWKERVNSNIIGIKQELIRTQERFDNLERALLGKVGEYGRGIESIHTEMKALEKVFEKILEPLVSNIKELDRITEKMKNIKK